VRTTHQLKVGDEAPDFTLKDDKKNEVTLSSYRGRQNVLLAFFVMAFTPV
jgi:peroxiredoxin (alkyl hydroperoxide reductase subunit C)